MLVSSNTPPPLPWNLEFIGSVTLQNLSSPTSTSVSSSHILTPTIFLSQQDLNVFKLWNFYNPAPLHTLDILAQIYNRQIFLILPGNNSALPVYFFSLPQIIIFQVFSFLLQLPLLCLPFLSLSADKLASPSLRKIKQLLISYNGQCCVSSHFNICIVR